MLTLTILGLAQAATWTVDPAGGGDATTVAEGVALLTDGDTLRIAAGTYDVVGVRVDAANVTFEGAGRDSTIFDGSSISDSSADHGLAVVGANVEIRSLTLRNYGTPGTGNGTALSIGKSGIVSNCAFWHNSTGVILGYSEAEETTIVDTMFAQNGFGIFILEDFDVLRIEGSTFQDNDTGLEYSMLTHNTMLFNRLSIINNTFVNDGQSIVFGGNATESRTSDRTYILEIVNNVFSGAGDRWWLTPVSWLPEVATIRNNVYAPTTTANVWDMAFTYTDNQEADAVFLSHSDDGDWTNDDLRLAEGSPGIDAGVTGYASLSVDAYDTPRSVDGDGDGTAAPDVGAFERCPTDDCAVPDTGDTGGAGTGAPPETASAEPRPADTWSLSCASGGAGRASGLLLSGALALSLWRRRRSTSTPPA